MKWKTAYKNKDNLSPTHPYWWAVMMARVHGFHCVCQTTLKNGMRLAYFGRRAKLIVVAKDGTVISIAYPSETEKKDCTWRLWVDSDNV